MRFKDIKLPCPLAVKVNTYPRFWYFRDQKLFVDWPCSVDAPPTPLGVALTWEMGVLALFLLKGPPWPLWILFFFVLHSKSVVGLQGTVLPNRSWGTRNSAYSCDPHSGGSPFGDLSGRDMLGIISCTPMATLTRCLPSSFEKDTSMHSRPSVTERPRVCVCLCVFQCGQSFCPQCQFAFFPRSQF